MQHLLMSLLFLMMQLLDMHASYYNYHDIHLFYDNSFITHLTIFVFVSFFLILGVSTPLFVTILESIETTKES